MRPFFRLVLAILCFCLPGSAQQSVPFNQVTDAPPAPLAPTGGQSIHIDVIVTDKSGTPVSGLRQQDFTLLDDKQPRAITSFLGTEDTGKPTEPPVQVIFLVDAVNSGVREVTQGRQELERFLRRDDGKLALPTSLVIFTDISTMIQPQPGHDGNAMADGLEKNQTGLRVNGRSQGFYGAVDRFQMSIRALQQITAYEARQPGRKLLIWLSPGWPLLSGPGVIMTPKDQETTFNEVVTMSRILREARMTLYSIDPSGMGDAGTPRTFYYEDFLKGVPYPNKVNAANLALQVLAVQSGGKVLNSNNNIANLIASCLVDAKAFYTLSFDSSPADHPDEYHSLEVKIAKAGLTAHTRTGYYAQQYKDKHR
jgi:VWFA-related protein